MTWEPEVAELRRRESLAHQMGGDEKVARQRAAGRLNVRERIARLADGGSFHETGALAGSASYDGETLTHFTPTNFVTGTIAIDGRRVVVSGDDFTVRGGAADASIHAKQIYAERMANELRLPIIRLLDGTGGGGSVRSLEEMGWTYVPHNPGWDVIVDNLGVVPVATACLGPVAGLGAARAVTSHFSVMVRGIAQVFVAGPPVVKMGMGADIDKETLGGADVHARSSGAIDNEAFDEDDALRQVRRFLSYLPSSAWAAPPRAASTDDPGRREARLLNIVPREPRSPYRMRDILADVFDHDSVFEIGAGYGRSLIAALARLDGRPVAVLANDPRVYAGGLTAKACEKMIRMVDLAETFHLPLVNLIDEPGFVIGVEAERAGTIRAGARALAAVYQASVPCCSILVRKVFGVAGGAHANAHRLNLRYAWPSGDWGSLPLSGGIEAAYKADLAAAEDPHAMLADITARLDAVRSPFRTAERFGVEEIVDPRDTRPLLCDWVALAYDIVERDPRPPARGPRP